MLSYEITNMVSAENKQILESDCRLLQAQSRSGPNAIPVGLSKLDWVNVFFTIPIRKDF